MFDKVYLGSTEIEIIYIGNNQIDYNITPPVEPPVEPPIDPDAVAPLKVDTFEAINVQSTQVELVWTFTGDTSNLGGFSILKDGVGIKEVDKDTRSLLVTGLPPNTIISFRNVSLGRNGNNSKPVSLSVRTPIT